MMKKLTVFILSCVILIGGLGIVCFADHAGNYLIDDASLLSSEEFAQIENKLEYAADKLRANVFVVIVRDTYGMSAENYAVSCADEMFTSEDGILFLFVTGDSDIPGSRDSYIFPSGRCEKKIDCNMIYDEIADFFSVNDYEAGFCGYADSCIKQMSYNLGKSFLISLVIGVIIALFIVSRMKGKLKTVRAQSGAAEYTRENSLNVTRSREIYLYSTISSVKKDNDSKSSSSSSGGSSHAGAGRKL